MSEPNLELTRVAYDAFLRGDFDAVLEFSLPDVVVEQPPDMPDARSYHGLEGLRQALTDWPSEWDDYEMRVIDMKAVGDDRVFVTARQSGRGKSSGIHVESDFTFVHTIKDGKQVRWQMFNTREEALEALGIEE